MSIRKSLYWFALCFSLSTNVWAEDAPSSIDTLIPKLATWGENAVLIAEVKAHNAKKLTLSAIKETDTKWMSTTGVDAFMQELMSNRAAVELKQLESSMSFLLECFLMDNQGANVAMTNKTSDYWQGDEAKFIESYNGGKGKVHVGPVKFDDSAQAYQVQISVPINDGGVAIGAITIGVNLDTYEASLK